MKLDTVSEFLWFSAGGIIVQKLLHSAVIHITISEPKIGHRVVKPIRVKAEQSIIPCQASSTYRICFKKRCTRWMERSATLRRVNRELHGIIGSNTITLTGQFAFQGEKEDQIACQGLCTYFFVFWEVSHTVISHFLSSAWIVTFNSIRGRVSPLLVLEVDGENPRNFTQEVQVGSWALRSDLWNSHLNSPVYLIYRGSMVKQSCLQPIC